MPREPPDYVLCREAAIAYFDAVDRAHVETEGEPLARYKEMEPACLDDAFKRALRRRSTGSEFLARLWSDNVFHQCLPNANHRTNLELTIEFARWCNVKIPADGDEQKFRDEADELFSISKKIISKRGEFGYGETELRRNHYKTAKRFFEGWVGQSTRPTTLRAVSLARFCRSGVSRKDRGGQRS